MLVNFVGRCGDGVGDDCYPGMAMTFVCVDILESVQMNIRRMNMKHFRFW